MVLSARLNQAREWEVSWKVWQFELTIMLPGSVSKHSSLICMRTMHWLKTSNIHTCTWRCSRACACPRGLWYLLCEKFQPLPSFTIDPSVSRSQLLRTEKPEKEMKKKKKPAYYMIYWKRSNVVPVKTCIIMLFWILTTIIVCNCWNFWTPVAFAVCQAPLIITNVQ